MLHGARSEPEERNNRNGHRRPSITAQNYTFVFQPKRKGWFVLRLTWDVPLTSYKPAPPQPSSNYHPESVSPEPADDNNMCQLRVWCLTNCWISFIKQTSPLLHPTVRNWQNVKPKSWGHWNFSTRKQTKNLANLATVDGQPPTNLNIYFLLFFLVLFK